MKFKKHISLLLGFLILVSSTGLAFNMHFCDGELASVSPVYLNVSQSIQQGEEGCCGIIFEKKFNCCKDNIVEFQKKSDVLMLKSNSFHPAMPFLIEEWSPIVWDFMPSFRSNPITSYYYVANAPPFFKLYHQYIFYA